MGKENKEEKKPGFFSRRVERIKNNSKKAVGAASINQGYREIKEMAQVLNPLKQRNANVETFEESYVRHGQTEEGIHSIYRALTMRFYTSVALTLLIWLKVLYDAFNGNVLLTVVSLGVSCVPVAIALTTAFRLHQIYIREWCTWNDWFNNAEGWWPKEWKGSSPKKKKSYSNVKEKI